MSSQQLEYLLCGWIIAALLAILRSNIDRHKGLLAEVVAINLPIAVAAALIVLTGNADSPLRLGRYLAPVVQLVFLAIPVMVGVRLLERIRQQDALQLVDLFRVTTSLALVLFVFSTPTNVSNWFDALLLTLLFCAADQALGTRYALRRVAIAFSVAFVVAVFKSELSGESTLTICEIPLVDRVWARSYFGFYFGWSLLALLAGVASGPALLHFLLDKARWWQRLALTAAAWRFAVSRAEDLIHQPPPLSLWSFRPRVCYLNHGSFGAVPNLIRVGQQAWREQCEREPMDLLARQADPQWQTARFELATWLGTAAENVAFCENATAGMNEIAHWFPLQADSQVLLNDHEYGAVRRIWDRACAKRGAELVTAVLPQPLTSPQQLLDAILERVTPRTQLVVVSHITSPTAIRLPVEALCQELRQRGVASCVDGPHALLQEPLNLHRLECDFYTASCHKWLCAPLGSGFVYVRPKWHLQIEPLRLSWGRLQPAQPEDWTEEMLWTGTRDFSAYLSVPAAIRYFQRFEWQKLDQRNHGLACYARQRLSRLRGAEPVTPEGREWFGWMVGVWLPPGNHSTLQHRLWTKYGIEVPIVWHSQRWLVRVSCHLYVTSHDINFLCHALQRELSVGNDSAT